jgi:hypothetical protein
VGRRGVRERPRQQLAVEVGVVLRNRREQLVDEVLVLLADVDDCHFFSVDRGISLQRIGGSGDEQEVPMRRFRKIRRNRSLEVARLLVALDRAAAEVRPAPVHRRPRVSVSR